jgi:hypothetical protein
VRILPKVYIPNKSIHDFSSAKEFGELIYLSKGDMKRFATNVAYRQFHNILKSSSPDDYLLISGLTMLNVVAAHILTKLHRRLNLLLFNPGKGGNKSYLERIMR